MLGCLRKITPVNFSGPSYEPYAVNDAVNEWWSRSSSRYASRNA